MRLMELLLEMEPEDYLEVEECRPRSNAERLAKGFSTSGFRGASTRSHWSEISLVISMRGSDSAGTSGIRNNFFFLRPLFRFLNFASLSLKMSR